MKLDRTVVTFFALFLLVYFLESIGGFYMTSAIVSIERQFQIPSKISGLMVSAGDFGYIPSVVFVSYLGGKGNRARWIGGGCVAIACSNLIISSSNFLFPVETISLNNTVLAHYIERDTSRLKSDAPNLATFLRDLSPTLRDRVQRKFAGDTPTAVTPSLVALAEQYKDSWLEQFERCAPLEARNQTDAECAAFYAFLKKHNAAMDADIDHLRLLSVTSYAFCDAALNRLRSMVERIRCSRNPSYVGPTATIFFGLMLLGIGRTMPFSLGLPLMDDNVKKRNLPIYFAGMFFIRIMGPVIGFMMGSFFNKFYYTSSLPQGITPKDPMWIGMWWGGFLVIGTALFGPSLALFFFHAPDEDEEVEDEEAIEDEEKAVIKAESTKVANEKKNGAHELLLVEKSPDGKVNFVRRVSADGKIANEKPATKKYGKKKRNPRSKLALVDRYVERHADGTTKMPETIGEKVRDFVTTISGVVRQPIYVGCLAGRIIDVLAFKGFYIFLPKYLEIQFGIPQYKINMYMGVIGVVGFALGVMAGSIVLRVFKLEGRQVAAWVAICSGVAACLSFVNAYVGCHSTLTSLGASIPNNFNINSSCLSGCDCQSVSLYPVCDRRGDVYYSPCHAGCRLEANFTTAADAFDTKKTPIFRQCQCISPVASLQVPNTIDNEGHTVRSHTKLDVRKTLIKQDIDDKSVSRDFCLDGDCGYQVILYFLNMAAGGIVGGMGVIPGMLIMLRSVPPKHRSVSLGFNGFLVSLLATLPSPIIWGAIIDHFCIYWDKKCDGRGACSLYATDQLRVWLHCIYGTLRLVALITDIYVIYHAKDLKVSDAFGAEDGDKEENSEFDQSKCEVTATKLEENESRPTEATEKREDERKPEDVRFREKRTSHSGPGSGKHSRNLSRDMRHSVDHDNLWSKDFRKSSTYIAGPISEYRSAVNIV